MVDEHTQVCSLSQPPMLACNFTAWVQALEHTVLAREDLACPLVLQLEAWLWGP